MKMTKSQFYIWARTQTRETENEMLTPENREIAGLELVELLPWDNFLHISDCLIDKRIEIIEEETK
ncbi:hypothetical protein [Carnobacterium jeotgali]|uniref:hypothetical protein n=1 Tax=Carnobacterium jeotgali TaxID=545534 RepID=UPI00388ED24B